MSTDKALLSRIKDSNYARWSIRMRFDEGHSIRDLFRECRKVLLARHDKASACARAYGGNSCEYKDSYEPVVLRAGVARRVIRAAEIILESSCEDAPDVSTEREESLDRVIETVETEGGTFFVSLTLLKRSGGAREFVLHCRSRELRVFRGASKKDVVRQFMDSKRKTNA